MLHHYTGECKAPGCSTPRGESRNPGRRVRTRTRRLMMERVLRGPALSSKGKPPKSMTYMMMPHAQMSARQRGGHQERVPCRILQHDDGCAPAAHIPVESIPPPARLKVSGQAARRLCVASAVHNRSPRTSPS